MVNSLMPAWALVVLTVAYLVILAVHARHLLEVHGQARIWHCAHVLMALGMVNMSVPAAWTGLDGMPVGASTAAGVFAVVALLCAAATGFAVRQRDRVALLWAMAAVGAAGMAWMYVYTDRGGWYAVGTVAFALWFLAEALLWATGSLTSRVHGLEYTTSKVTRETTDPAAVPAAASGIAGGGVATAAASARTGLHPAHEHSRVARTTLAVMALGMAWMLLAMQFGISDMSGMPAMGGAGHHH